jgi:hypothetical protein
MLAPDGTSGEIPQGRVADAVNAGFKLAVRMTSPDGQNGYIPQERAADAIKAGFKQVDALGLTANPRGEGTYAVNTPIGGTIQVPYSNVPVAQGLQGYTLASADAARFEKDAAADPHHPSFWNALTNPVGSGGRQQGVVGGALQVGGQAIKAMAQPVLHPIKTAAGMAKVAGDVATQGPQAIGQDVVEPLVQQYVQDKEQGGNALALENLGGQVLGTVEGGRVMGAAASGVKPSAALGAAGEAPVAGAEGPVNTVSGANRLIPEAVRNGALPSAWDFAKNQWNPKGLLAGDVNAPIVGTEPPLTPAARYASMQNMGLQPNAAEATNSTPLNMAEKVNQNSLTAAPTYAAARAANLAALKRFTDRTLDAMSPYGPEEGGAAVQQGLLQGHADLKTAATEAFKNLDAQVGDQPMPGAAGLRQQAQAILDENAPYYKLHPELEPTKAMAIVRDLAEAKAPARPAPVVIPGFTGSPAVSEVVEPRVPTYSELHRVRSDLLDFNNTNPDLVKNQANGWISQLAGAADQAITSGEGALTPAQLDNFRDANGAWKFMKDTYDNPSHPFYQAVRNPSPSTLVNGGSGISRTPEMVRTLEGILGPEGMGPIQRGVAEQMLRTTKEGGYNFKTFQGQWNKLKPAYRDALFTPEQRQQLADIGNAGTVLHEDLNPSGTAKLGQGQAEMLEGSGAIGAAATGHPGALAGTAAYHATQYALGKLMNSPTFVDWLMRDQGLPAAARTGTTHPMIPAAVASGGMATGWDWQNSKPKEGRPDDSLFQRSKAAFNAERDAER